MVLPSPVLPATLICPGTRCLAHSGKPGQYLKVLVYIQGEAGDLPIKNIRSFSNLEGLAFQAICSSVGERISLKLLS